MAAKDVRYMGRVAERCDGDLSHDQSRDSTSKAGRGKYASALVVGVDRAAGRSSRHVLQESVRHEQAYLLKTADGPVLIYVMEADDTSGRLPPSESLSSQSIQSTSVSWPVF